MKQHNGSPATRGSDIARLRRMLRAQADPVRARLVAAFFKTGRGGYGEGDRFIGVTVPAQRRVAREFHSISLRELESLLQSPIHEERLTALLIFGARCRRPLQSREPASIVRIYLRNLRYVNNWDLVDTSAAPILGACLQRGSRATLTRLARSRHLWSRRVAMIATYHFILQGESGETLRIAELLLDDPHDLIHKASGWMLREVGKRVAVTALRGFLGRHAGRMPRTMLRYAIEHLSAAERQRWLAVVKG